MKRATFRKVLRCGVAILLGLGWTVATATATAVQALVAPGGHDLIGLPWAQAGVAALISLWGGATATLERYLAAKYDARVFHTRHEVAKDLAVSISVGVVCYFAAGDFLDVSPTALGATQVLAGYAGVRLLKAGGRVLNRVLPDKGEA